MGAHLGQHIFVKAELIPKNAGEGAFPQDVKQRMHTTA
jgi:hypothetical protein